MLDCPFWIPQLPCHSRFSAIFATTLNLGIPFQVQLPLCPPPPYSSTPSISLSSAGEGGSTWKQGQLTNLRDFTDQSSQYWEQSFWTDLFPISLRDSRSYVWNVLARARQCPAERPGACNARLQFGEGWFPSRSNRNETLYNTLWEDISPEKVSNFCAKR